MSLKQSIVIVNEYTIKNGSKSGSRGGTPGDYVMRYMSRTGATEDITPTRLYDVDDYIIKYMARENAVESYNSIPEIKHSMKKAQKYGGVAFGYGDVALSDEHLRWASRDIQNQFDIGKTCFKTVISFDEEYLRENGIIEDDFYCQKKGDYRGHVDQMKLRMAIMNGIQKMSKNFDDLQFVGVIQVDTKHVHCHLCMVDRGHGNLAKDGTQRGKLSPNNKSMLRRGIDTYLDRKQKVKMMSSSVMYDKRNAVCYIKKFAHKTMAQQGLPQFLLACLPDDRNLWRASTNRKEMRKANTIVREYVLDLLEQPDSGYRESMRDITAYADYRTVREGLSNEEHNKLIRQGQNDLIDNCINAVYASLRKIPKSAMTVRTPMLESMAMDYDEMAAQAVNDPMVEFGFKLRSYSSRMNHHKKEYHKYRDEVRTYDATADKSEDSKVLGDYLREEQNYNAMLMVKYQYFLSFLPSNEDVEKMFNDLMREKDQLENLEMMRYDNALQRMQGDIAEDYGLKVYSQHGGRRVKESPQIIDRRIEKFRATIKQHEDTFRDTLRDYGMDYDGTGVTRKKMYDFDSVKALDLHHLGYDFPYDVQISKINIDRFKEAANRRYNSFQGAKEYLQNSGQEMLLRLLPEKDVVFMKQYADKLTEESILATSRPVTGHKRKTATVRLGKDYTTDMQMMVKSTISSAQIGVEHDGLYV